MLAPQAMRAQPVCFASVRGKCWACLMYWDDGRTGNFMRLVWCAVGAVEVAGACQRTSASKGKQAVQPLYAPIHLPDAALACTATVQGLECGTEYLFRVHALNRIGASPVSEPGRQAWPLFSLEHKSSRLCPW